MCDDKCKRAMAIVLDLMSVIEPFAIAAKGMSWEHTPDHLAFYPVNSLLNGKPITAFAMRRAMEAYEMYSKKETG